MTATEPGAARKAHIEFEYINTSGLEIRASFALKALAVVNGFGVVLALVPPSPPVANLQTVVFQAAAAVLVGVMLVTMVAIDREQPWAIAAIRPLFVAIGLAGIALVAMAVAAGGLRIPFDAVLAVWVLLGKPNTKPMPPPERRTIVAGGVATALLGLMLSSGWLFRWGGPLDVAATDLTTSLAADCTTHLAGTPLPETIAVTFDWSWAAWRPLPSGVDVVVIGWDGNDGAGKVEYFTGDSPDPDDDGIHPGLRAYPSSTMASAVMTETRNHWVWGIKLDEQGYEPGHIDVTLELVNSVPVAEPLRITATYIHEGAWRKDTATLTCAW